VRITPSNSVRAEGETCVDGRRTEQGATISKFYSGSYCNGGPCTFTVGFENSGNVKYCDGKPQSAFSPPLSVLTPLSLSAYAGGSCANDGNEEIGSGGSQRRNVGNATMAATPKYRTGSGSEVLIPGGAAIGQTALRVVAINQTLWGNQADSHNFSDEEVDGYDTQYDYMHENLVVEKDTIVERIG